MILIGENPLLGPVEGVGPKNLDFFGPKWNLLRSWPFPDPKMSQFSGPTPSTGPRNPAPYKQQVH